QVPYLPRLLLADEAGEVGGAESRVDAPDARPHLPEARVLGGEAEIADHLQHVAAADRPAVDGRDDRLRDVADDDVQLLDVEPEVGACLPPLVTACAPHRLITARAEGTLAGAGQ